MKRFLIVLFGVLAFGTGLAQADWIRDKAINWSGYTYTSEGGKTFALYENSTVRNWKALSRTYDRKRYRSGPISEFIKSCLEACTHDTRSVAKKWHDQCSGGVALIYRDKNRTRPTMCLFASHESEVMAVGGSSRQTYDFYQIVPNLAYYEVRAGGLPVGVNPSAFDDCEIDKEPIWCRDVASSSTPRESESEPVDGTPWADLTDAQKAIATPCWQEKEGDNGSRAASWVAGGSRFWDYHERTGWKYCNERGIGLCSADTIRKWATDEQDCILGRWYHPYGWMSCRDAGRGGIVRQPELGTPLLKCQ